MASPSHSRCKGPTIVVLLAALAAATLAQPVGDEPDLKAIERITQEAIGPSQLDDIARQLTDVYGPRVTGSPHLKAGAAHVTQRLKSWGVQNVSYERWGPFGPGWTNDRFTALSLAPQAFPLTAFPKAWTPGTSGDVIAEAVLAPIEDDRDFVKYRGKLQSTFVLTAPIRDAVPTAAAAPRRYSAADLSGLVSVPPARSTPDEAQLRRELEFARKRMDFYIKEGVAALLEPSRGDGGVVFVGDGRLRDDSAFAGGGLYPWPDPVAPQVVVAAEQYNRIARNLNAGISVTLEMNIVNTYHPAEPDSFNIIAEIPARQPSPDVVMMGAHFDSWHSGTGATDNAAGCAVLLEAMRILKATGLQMRRTVRLALWTGSEQGLMGSRAYVAEHFADPATMRVKPEHAKLSAYFNLDGGTGAIRGLYLESNDAVAPLFASWMAPFENAGMIALSPRSAGPSDHLPFDAVGLPAFQFIQDPAEYETRTRHSNLDVYDRLQISDLIQNAAIVAAFIYHVANREELLPRKPLR